MIKIHNITQSKIGTPEESLKILEIFLGLIKTSTETNLLPIKDRLISFVRCSIIHGNKDYAFNGIKGYVQLGLAHFHRILSESDRVTVNFGKQQYEMTKLGDDYGLNAFSWIEILELATLIEDKDLINEILAVKIWEVKKDDEPYNIKFAEYLYTLSVSNKDERFKLLYDLKEDAESDLGLLVNDNESKSISVSGRADTIKVLKLPILNLYETILKQDENTFNEILRSYLQNKKQYIINQEMEDDPRFWIDFSALAACKLALKNSINIKVESDYIPVWICKGEFGATEELF